MKIAISQPTYIPWLGQFDLIDHADIFVFYDDVQIVKQSWDTRNRIMTSSGSQWLSVPLSHEDSYNEKYFNSTYIIESEIWKVKHYKTIMYAYSKSKFFKQTISFVKELIVNNKNETLGEFNKHIIRSIAEKIGISTQFVSSSSLDSKAGSKDYRLLDICKELNAKKYISPLGAAKYIEANNPGGAFHNTSIDLYYQNYEHPIYNQFFKPFNTKLSIIDLLFNEGHKNALRIIRSGRKSLFKSNDLTLAECNKKF